MKYRCPYDSVKRERWLFVYDPRAGSSRAATGGWYNRLISIPPQMFPVLRR